MNSGAHVASIDAIRDFLAALHTFAHQARDSLDSYDMEVQRSLDELLEAEPQFWQHELRKAEDLVTQTKIELERCRHSRLPGGDPRSCLEERRAHERARLRRDFAEDKIQIVRKLGNQVQHQADEYGARATQLRGQIDAELPRAIALLTRVLNTLEEYTSVAAGSSTRTRPIAPKAPDEKPTAERQETDTDDPAK